jgi:uncharacterized protein
MRCLKVHGIAYAKEIAFSTRFAKFDVKKELELLADAGQISRVKVEGLKGPLFMLPEYGNKKITITGDAFILSPFDIINVFRHRLRDFFEFDYQIECFVPAAKRKYGYFSLPILIGDKFVARMDSKADRKNQKLIVNNLHFEKTRFDDEMLTKLYGQLNAFSKFNQCEEIVMKKTNNTTLRKAIVSRLAS